MVLWIQKSICSTIFCYFVVRGGLGSRSCVVGPSYCSCWRSQDAKIRCETSKKQAKEVSGSQKSLQDLQKASEGGLRKQKAAVRPQKSKLWRSQDAKIRCETSKNANPPRTQALQERKPSIKQAKNIILPQHP